MELKFNKGGTDQLVSIISSGIDHMRLSELLATYWNKLLAADPDEIGKDTGSVVFLRPSIRVEDSPLNTTLSILDDQPVFIPVDVVEMDEFDARYFNIGQDFASAKDRLLFAKQQLALAKTKPRQVYVENVPVMNSLDEFYVEVEDFQVTVDSTSKIARDLQGYIPIPKKPISASIVGYCVLLEKIPAASEPYHIQMYSEGILGYHAMANYIISVSSHDSR